jgi:hypothetical protein
MAIDILEDLRLAGMSHSFAVNDMEAKLEQAVTDADLKLTHTLVNNGASLIRKNKNGKIPLDLAVDSSIQKFLKGL